MIDIHIDSCAWNFLLEFGVDLGSEFPADSFRLWIPREIEMELAAIPSAKAELLTFIRDAVARCGVRADVWFGFSDPDTPPAARKVGGFGEGRWITRQEGEFVDANRRLIGSGDRPKTHLKKNEADLALAARSLSAVVLTADVKPAGPLAAARSMGGNVLDIRAYRAFPGSFRVFVTTAASVSG